MILYIYMCVRVNFPSNNRIHPYTQDTIFNVIDHQTCVLLDTVMGEDSPKKYLSVLARHPHWLTHGILSYTQTHRRTIREFVRQSDGKYVLERRDIEFSEFLQQEGFKVIPLSEEVLLLCSLSFAVHSYVHVQDQEKYGLNMLNLGNGC